MTRHSPYVITLSAADQAVLEKRARSYTARHADVVRAKIVLMCADGHRNTEIAARLNVHVNVVATWRKRFFEAGLDGLTDRPRPGRPRSVPSEVAEVRAMGGEPSVERGVPVTGPGAIRQADRAGGRRPARRSRRPSSNAPAPAGQLIPFQPRYNAAATLDALRHLVSLINRYLAEVDAEHSRNRAGVPTPRKR
jgi:hypothetical protein